jgi:hypothetical protein
VLAALDVHTAKWIIEKCFSGDLMRGRTVILVVRSYRFLHLHALTIYQTHNVAMASPIAEFVVSMGKDGRIHGQGSVTDAIAEDTAFATRVSENVKTIEKAEDEIDSMAEGETKQVDGKLVVEEEIEEGHVSLPARECFRLSALSAFKHLLQ